MAPVAPSRDPAASGGNSQYSFRRHLIWLFSTTVVLVVLFYGLIWLSMGFYTKMAPGVTAEKFKSIRPGMSMEEMQQILGEPLKREDLTQEEAREHREWSAQYRPWMTLPPGTVSYLNYSKPSNWISAWELYRVEVVNGRVVDARAFPMD